MTPADRLRSLVKEATPVWKHIWTGEVRPVYEDNDDEPRDFTDADWALVALAPQLAELVADMDDLLRRLSEWDVLNLPEGSGDDGPYWQGKIAKVRPRLAALFPEDSA